MKKFYYVRHGQTVLNTENRVCGVTESPLTEKGIQQAKEAGLLVKSMIEKGEIEKIDEILCSPLTRARETARYISEATGIPLKVDNRLIEQNFGKYEGALRTPEFEKLKSNFVFDYEGGESMMRLAQRVYNFLDWLKTEEKTYLLVAHGGLSRCIYSYFHNMTNEEYGKYLVENGKILTFEMR